MDEMMDRMNCYYNLSPDTIEAMRNICYTKIFKRDEIILRAGDTARNYYFVKSGLLGYYGSDKNGTSIYKIFFEENSFCASTSSLIEEKPSLFSIDVLEDSELIVCPADKFRKLISEHHDLALFYIAYLEKNWVVKKEPLEIILKSASAKERYLNLLQNTKLVKRLKQHQIASYLGVTPTQLSRIRKVLDS